LERCLPEVPGESNNPGSTRKHFPGSGEKFGGFNKRRRNSDVKKNTCGHGVIWSEPASYLDEKDGSIMLTSTIKRNAFRVLATLAFAAAPAFASLITVNNYNFEMPSLGGVNTICLGVGCSYNTGPIQDWNNGVGLSSGEGKYGTGTSPLRFSYYTDPPTIAWSNGDTISQMVGPTVGVGTTYKLSVDIGQRGDPTAGSFGGSADLLIGGTALNGGPYTTMLAGGTAPASGGWSTFTLMYTGTVADAGASITIELKSVGVVDGVNHQGNFDNVRLDVVPEPTSFLLIGSALLALRAFRRRRPIA
jgi:hypothetical protein